ncbi:MAG: exopolysaccharide biosynthesis protein [Pseudomarimonas sp.]
MLTASSGELALGERLKALMTSLPDGDTSVGSVVDALGMHGLLLLTIMLTLVFLIPVSIPGVSTVFGAVILLIALARLTGRPLWLPTFVSKRPVSASRLRDSLALSLVWVQRFERISRHGRWPRLVSSRATQITANLGLVLGAVLLMAPLGMVPFSNTLPALGLMGLSIGLLQQDGVMVLLGHVSNLLSIIYFAALFGGGAAAMKWMVG